MVTNVNFVSTGNQYNEINSIQKEKVPNKISDIASKNISPKNSNANLSSWKKIGLICIFSVPLAMCIAAIVTAFFIPEAIFISVGFLGFASFSFMFGLPLAIDLISRDPDQIKTKKTRSKKLS
jgi:hypothetical protein